MNSINITSATDIKLISTPVILDIDHNHSQEALCSVTCEAEITTNNVTFRVHAIATCERVDDGFGKVTRLDGWLDMRAKAADGVSIESNAGALVELTVSTTARREIVNAILTPFMHHLRVSDAVHHIPIKPFGYIFQYKTWEDNSPMFVLCKQGTLFGVYNQKEQTIEAFGCATKQEAQEALLYIIARKKESDKEALRGSFIDNEAEKST